MEALSWVSFILQVLIMGFLLYIEHDRPEPEGHPTCRSCRHCQPIPEDLQHFFMPTERHCDCGRGYDVPFDDEIHGAISAVQVTDYCSKFSQRR